jgi:hypothetical protein
MTGLHTSAHIIAITNLKVYLYSTTTGAFMRSVPHGYSTLASSAINSRAIQLTSGEIVFASTNTIHYFTISPDNFYNVTTSQTQSIS